jgi:hypothetical protein
MKKILLLILAGVAIFYCFIGLTHWYNRVEEDIEGKNRRKIEQQQEVAGADIAGPADPAVVNARSAGRSKASSPAAAVQSAASQAKHMISTLNASVHLCSVDIPAFDPQNPGRVIGTFLKGTPLIVGTRDVKSGKYFVSFTQKDGTVIRALCEGGHIGRS